MSHSQSSDEAYPTDDDNDGDYYNEPKTPRKRKTKRSASSNDKLTSYKDLRLGFSLFQIQKKQEIIDSVPENLRNQQHWFMKAASKAWKAISQEEKTHYNDISATEIGKIHTEKRRRKKAGKQKRVSGYQMYLAHQMKLGRGKSVDHKEWVKSIGSAWRGMSDADREPFVKEASQRNEEYEKQYSQLLETIDVDAVSEDEDIASEEESVPRKRRRTKVNFDDDDLPPTPVDLEPLHPNTVVYMNTLLKARLDNLITVEQYNAVKPLIISKPDADEFQILMRLLNESAADGIYWNEQKGSEFLDNVVKVLA